MARTPITYGIPTTNVFRGWIKTTEDALLIFEAARQGIVPRVTRRFHEVEKYATLKSGAVVVFTEEESGIKRWTDPFLWSASRVMGNFMIYREREDPESASPYLRTNIHGKRHQRHDFELDRMIYGSWNKGRGLKEDGLVKKTISMTIEGIMYHLVSYYNAADIRSGALWPASMLPELAGVEIGEAVLREIHRLRQPPRVEKDENGKMSYLGERENTYQLAFPKEEEISPTQSPLLLSTKNIIPPWATPELNMGSRFLVLKQPKLSPASSISSFSSTSSSPSSLPPSLSSSPSTAYSLSPSLSDNTELPHPLPLQDSMVYTFPVLKRRYSVDKDTGMVKLSQRRYDPYSTAAANSRRHPHPSSRFTRTFRTRQNIPPHHLSHPVPSSAEVPMLLKPCTTPQASTTPPNTVISNARMSPYDTANIGYTPSHQTYLDSVSEMYSVPTRVISLKLPQETPIAYAGYASAPVPVSVPPAEPSSVQGQEQMWGTTCMPAGEWNVDANGQDQVQQLPVHYSYSQ